jgi:hypothetical protein
MMREDDNENIGIEIGFENYDQNYTGNQEA